MDLKKCSRVVSVKIITPIFHVDFESRVRIHHTRHYNSFETELRKIVPKFQIIRFLTKIKNTSTFLRILEFSKTWSARLSILTTYSESTRKVDLLVFLNHVFWSQKTGQTAQARRHKISPQIRHLRFPCTRFRLPSSLLMELMLTLWQ